jgi:hypothetical protein
MKPNMKENAKANKHTKTNCCHVNLMDFKILSSNSILANMNINENE